ncbi:MFS transporter [Francisella sp. 19X1-34]|uniref:MFS transporter n=1 Tax=Francisella sp. 19X1-34 TaxID=3087177 RepID=UPI002E2FDB58|nr:MFS transporter [Francisella sp. 19X1-34]MED7788727.1 MFS transporter [Francisella sp. 19X1-34]
MRFIYINRNENYTEQPHKQKQQTKLIEALFKQYKQIIIVSLITCMCASLYYMVFTYLVNYQIEYQHISESKALFLNSIVLFFACIFYPVFGYISDKYGHIKVFYLALIALVLLFYPLIMLIAVNNFIISFLAILIFCIIMAAIQGAVSPFFALVFDSEWRATGCAISYSIGNGISGAAPLLAGLFTAKYGISGLALYTLILVVAGTVGSLGIYKTMKNSI